MRIGIIGSTGFIGKSIYAFLKSNTNFKVTKFASFYKYKNKWIDKIIKEINLNKPEVIINCSAYTKLNNEKNYLKKLINTNIYSNIIFLNEAVKNNNFKSYISFGTKWELGNTKNKVPLNLYAASKKANDSFYEFYSNNQNSIISLKLFDTYGANDNRDKLMNSLIENYKNDKTLNMTEGKQYLDYVNIKDICLLISKILKDVKFSKIRGFHSYTVSSKRPIKLVNFVKLLNKILKKKVKIRMKKKYRKNETFYPTKNYNNYPNWDLKCNFEEELKKLFDK
jgi:CDP-3, 6-dideoxy-D-glycero-L-glycero-4-hexulose-4-reductase